MLDVSISELALVGLVGFLVLGPKEMLSMIKSARSIITSLKSYYEEFIKHLNKELEADDDYVKIIMDNEGHPQKVYDLEKIKPYIKEEEKNDLA
jgi:Sec-independent protein translocase protein TatA